MFLKIEGVPGESTDEKHRDWIEIQSFSWGSSRQVTGSGGTRTNGPTKVDDFSIRKEFDKSTPILMESLCQGKVFPKVEIHMQAARATNDTYLSYTLQDCIISSIQSGGSASSSNGAALPLESLSLNFTKIEMRYTDVDRATGNTNSDVIGTCTVGSGTP